MFRKPQKETQMDLFYSPSNLLASEHVLGIEIRMDSEAIYESLIPANYSLITKNRSF